MVTGRDLHCSDSPSPNPFEVNDLGTGFCVFLNVYDQWLCPGGPNSDNKKNKLGINHRCFRKPNGRLLWPGRH